MNNDSQKKPGRDESLAQLYIEGAKETPPAKLNYEIINYASNATKSTFDHGHVSSHFSGGWKVPLSLATSILVVFALLIHLDQSPKQLEPPPMHEMSVPSESSNQALESLSAPADTKDFMADDISSFKHEAKKSDIDSDNLNSTITNEIDTNTSVLKECQPATKQINPTVKRKVELQRQTTCDHFRLEESLEKSRPTSEYRFENNSNNQAPAAPLSTISKSKAIEDHTPIFDKPQPTKKQMPVSINDASGSSLEATSSGVIQQRSMGKEKSMQSHENTVISDITIDREMENEEELAAIPVEDWLLMIVNLIARKDYAEAARQLEKFKLAHPKVNVEDLDTKIP